MPRFDYIAIDETGRQVRGAVDADSEAAAHALIEAGAITVTSLTARPCLSLSSPPLRPRRRAWVTGPLEQRSAFAHLLAQQLRAGIAPFAALDFLSDMRPDRLARLQLAEAAQMVRAGATLHDALAACPHFVAAEDLPLVAAGERAGIVADALDELARELDVRRQLQHHLQWDYFHARLTATTCLVAAALWRLFLLPSSEWAPVAAWMLGACAATAGLLVVWHGWIACQPGVRRRVDAWRLRTPGFGKLELLMARHRLLRWILELHRAGAPLADAVESAVGACGNSFLQQRWRPLARRVRHGQALTSALASVGALPADQLSQLQRGETGGALEQTLESLANEYADGIEKCAANARHVVRPYTFAALAIIMGGAVALGANASQHAFSLITP